MTISPTHTSPGSGPLVFGRNSDLFGWLHRPDEATNKPAIVICNPVGFEFVRAYRALRILAEQLAASGHIVLRFDYRTTGDSAGEEADADVVHALLESTREAIEFAANVSGNQQVALVGLRLGATIAAKVAETAAVEQLVLWAPCDSGAIYVREQQIMAAAQKKKFSTAGDRVAEVDGVDAGGFLLTPETQNDLSSLKLDADPFPGAPDILLLNRDDIRVPPTLSRQLESRGSTLTVAESPDFKNMMLPPQLATVPDAAIEKVVDWFETYAMTGNIPSIPESNVRKDGPSSLEAGNGIEETPLTFGPGNRLFGVLSHSRDQAAATKPALILLCGGATHRVSANRMYVPLARRLASDGSPVMRMDIAGIGDSLPHDNYPANKPYTDKLTSDIDAAMNAVQALTGERRFILFGLCSGAYAAMQAAKQSERVTGLILANQLVYHLSANDLGRLASGEIASAHELDFPRSSSLPYRAAVRLLKRISPAWGVPGEWLAPWILGGRPRRDFDQLIARNVQLAFVLSSRDDAVDALSITSGKRVTELVRDGKATMKVFSGVDHTFSPSGSQRELIDWVADYVAGFGRP
ncbi:MAG: alpha/beta hydrolase [Gammaproteobacteria bacterium]|nr:alpha/beta hydrolase [Gammaproteobacteria bacterium]